MLGVNVIKGDATTAGSLSTLAEASDVIFLSVKPFIMGKVVEELANHVKTDKLVSLCAIQDLFPSCVDFPILFLLTATPPSSRRSQQSQRASRFPITKPCSHLALGLSESCPTRLAQFKRASAATPGEAPLMLHAILRAPHHSDNLL